jgi:hypothetical protein
MLPGGKGSRCVGLTTLPPSCAECLEIWETQPPGTLSVFTDLKWDCILSVKNLGYELYILSLCMYENTCVHLRTHTQKKTWFPFSERKYTEKKLIGKYGLRLWTKCDRQAS